MIMLIAAWLYMSVMLSESLFTLSYDVIFRITTKWNYFLLAAL